MSDIVEEMGGYLGDGSEFEEAIMNPNPKPSDREDSVPKPNCICASFWTVRRAHKKDCPLADTSDATEREKLEIKSIVDRWYELRKERETKEQFEQELREYISTEKTKLLEALEAKAFSDFNPEGHDHNACALHDKYTASCSACQRQHARHFAQEEVRAVIQQMKEEI
jgi:hypothetical protein